ncbi:MAG: DUF3298 domain-containing protein [Lachnospiraceae bacterium]|nr:DUF3298 domain-containing protein [Lachnospiraceae bacterium]
MGRDGRITVKKEKNMKKKAIMLVSLLLCLGMLSACGKKEAAPDETVKEEPVAAAAEEPAKKEDTVEEKTEKKEEAVPEPEAFDPKKLEFKDRFLAGNRNIYYIDDDDSINQVLRCTEEEESIVYAGGSEGFYYVLINDGHMKYTLYHWNDKDNDHGKKDLELDDNTGVFQMAAYKGCFYYDYYDGKDDSYPVWKYDPKKDELTRTVEMETMKKYLDSYKGKSMTTLDYMSFIPGDLAKTGHMFRRNSDDGTVVVFDESGNEVCSVKPELEGGDWDILSDTYIFQNYENYAGSGRVSDESCIVFNIKTGISHPVWEGKSDSEGFGTVDIKDGYFYYYIEEKNPDGSTGSRKYYREKEEELEQKDLNGELLIEIPEWSGVTSSFISEDDTVFNGFSPKGRRAYYLWFDDDKDSKHRGDVSWRAVDMERLQHDDDTIVTDAVEMHESFADFGYIETDREAEKKDNFRYFTSLRDRFYFYDEIKNADAMNKVLQEKYDENAGFAKDTKETALNDVFGEDAVYDLADPDAWAPSYSYDVNLGSVEEIGSHYMEVSFGDYVYYGGAHGMPGVSNYLFDTETGSSVTIKDLFSGSEKEFRDIVVNYTMDDWKNSGDKYYEGYDPSLEKSKRQEFEELASFDMIIDFAKDGINVGYSPYAVGPFASGFIEVFIPYSALNIEM